MFLLLKSMAHGIIIKFEQQIQVVLNEDTL